MLGAAHVPPVRPSDRRRLMPAGGIGLDPGYRMRAKRAQHPPVEDDGSSTPPHGDPLADSRWRGAVLVNGRRDAPPEEGEDHA